MTGWFKTASRLPGFLFALTCFALTAAGGCSDGTKPAQLPGTGEARRIVALAPSLAELVFAAGAGEYLVGTVEYSDFPPPAQIVPRVGNAFRVDLERLTQLQPDLVLVWGSGNPADMQLRLKELGFPVLTLEPRSLEDVAKHVRLVGRFAGTQNIADAAATAYSDSLAETFASYAAEPSQKVFFQISADPWFTVNGEHVISRIIGRCGGINVFADADVLAPSVSLEAIIAADPDVIVAAVARRGQTDWQQQWQRFDRVSAVRNQQLVGIESDKISRSGLRLADGARQLCSALAGFREAGS